MKETKPSLFGALKYLLVAIPLLFGAPIIITIGFKALKKENNYLFLILGIILAIIAMIVTARGVIKIVNYLFDKENDA